MMQNSLCNCELKTLVRIFMMRLKENVHISRTIGKELEKTCGKFFSQKLSENDETTRNT